MQRGIHAAGADELAVRSSLDDPSGRLKAHGSIMGHAVVAGPADVDEALFAGWLREAGALARPPRRAAT